MGSIAQQVADSDPSRKFRYLGKGHAKLEIQKIEITKTRKKVQLYAVTLKMLEGKMKDQHGVKYKKGSIVNWSQPLMEDWAPPNIKGFLMAALGTEDPDKITAKIFDKSSSKKQKMAGLIVKVVTVMKKKKNGDMTSISSFSPDD